MAFDLSTAAKLSTQKVNIEPQLVLEIEGVSTRFSVKRLMKRVEIGDPGLYIGDDWLIGGTHEVFDQEPLIALGSGTTTSITQQLDPSKGLGSSISSMAIVLVDKDGKATELASPGVVVDDILGRRAKVRLGFQDTSFPDDYVAVFRGIIDDVQVGAGYVKLNLAHPDQKKRQTLFTKQTITEYLVDSQNPLYLVIDTDKFYFSIYEPDTLRTYLKYGDEYIRYSRNEIGSITFSRAQLGTSQNPEPLVEGSELETFHILEGNVIDLALKLMLSDKVVTPYAEDIPITSFKWIDVDTSYDQGIYFAGRDLIDEIGISVGDFITIPGGFPNGTVFDRRVRIQDIITLSHGTVIIADRGGGLFYTVSEERVTTKTVSFTSQYNTLGVGLGMKPDEVDIAEHLRIKRLFLSGVTMRFYMKDEVNLKDFIHQELYAAVGAYALPRKSKASVGMHIGPIPGAQAAIISADDVIDPQNLIVRRGLAQNFMNTLIYKFDEDLSSDEKTSSVVETDEDSVNRIKVGTRAQIVESKGLRADLNGFNIAQAAARRKLNRYKFAAESIDNISIKYAKGFNIEVGDIILFDGSELQLINSKDGNRVPSPKLVEVINKTLDVKGTVRISIVDTSYSTQKRYGLISPSSIIKQGISQTKFLIQASFNSPYGSNEFLKWSRLMPGRNATVGIKVRSSDFTTRFFETTIKSISGNTIEVNDPLGFTPQAGDVMEFASYDFEGTTAIQKSLYAYMQNASTFPSDNGIAYSML